MRVVNRTRGTVVAAHVEVADGVWSRFRGYLGRPEPAEGEGLLLAPCNAVHTFGMTYELDVLFLDSRGAVLEMAQRLSPWRKTHRVRGARYALEVKAGTIEATETETGDELAWMPPRGTAARAAPHAKDHLDTSEGSSSAPSRRT